MFSYIEGDIEADATYLDHQVDNGHYGKWFPTGVLYVCPLQERSSLCFVLWCRPVFSSESETGSSIQYRDNISRARPGSYDIYVKLIAKLGQNEHRLWLD